MNKKDIKAVSDIIDTTLSSELLRDILKRKINALADPSSIEFVSYTGKYPNLCSGTLTLKIDGKIRTFGDESNCDYKRFWAPGGSCDYNMTIQECEVKKAPWKVIKRHLPDVLKSSAKKLGTVFNNNVPYGCCGGCV